VADLPYLSFSRLNTYNGCGLKYKLAYIDGVAQRPSGAFLGGGAVHDAIQFGEQSDRWATDAGVAVIADFFLDVFLDRVADAEEGDLPIRWGGRKSRDWPEGEDETWWKWYGPVAVRRYAAIRRADEAAGYQVREGGTEMRIGAALPDGTQVVGYVDAFLIVTGDGELLIRDWKTGRPYGNDPLQLATYAWAMDQAGIASPTCGQYVYLKTADRKKAFATFDLTPFIPIVERLYVDLATGIRSGHFPLKPGMFCSSCSVAHKCPYGKAVAID
jgi:putative RecB family exonuclease